MRLCNLYLSHYSALPTWCDLCKYVFGIISSVLIKTFLLSSSTGDSTFIPSKLSQRKTEIDKPKFSVCPVGATITIESLSCSSALISQGCDRPGILEDRRSQFTWLIVHIGKPTRVFRVL